MEEIWKDVEGYIGRYQVSNLGNIKSLNYRGTGQERLLSATPVHGGYLAVSLCDGNTQKTFRVHKLVAEAFIENLNNKPCVDHINTIKTDNRADNLRWVTHKENNANPLTIEHKISCIKGCAKRVFCEGTIYNSGRQCAKYYNVSKSTMNDWLTGKCSMPADFQAKGLRYYIEE